MSNKNKRKQLEDIYGKKCMFKKAKVEKQIKKIGGIKTYKKFIGEKKYTKSKVKEWENIITLHHLKHKAEGRRNNSWKWSFN